MMSSSRGFHLGTTHRNPAPTEWNHTPPRAVKPDDQDALIGVCRKRAARRLTTRSYLVRISLGYEIVYDHPRSTPMLLTLHIHPSRARDLIVPDTLITEPFVPISIYHDTFGNQISRIVAPSGPIRLSSKAVVNDSGLADPIAPGAIQHKIEDLPQETLLFLLGSRYCETDHLSQIAWNLFGGTPLGWARVQAICDFVHRHLAFGYHHARPTKTAWEAYQERAGVCRDFAHLAIAFCRCMNIPARYCTGYLGDIGVPPMDAPMDFLRMVRSLPRRRFGTCSMRDSIRPGLAGW